MKTGRGPKAATSATSIKQTERRAEVLRLRLDGMTLAAIGDRLGIRADSVHDIITRALASMAKEPAEELLGLELVRLDSLYAEAMNVLRSFTPLLHNGRVVQIPVINRDGEIVKDPGTGQPITCIAEDKAARLAAIAAAVRVMERRSRLLGLDAPSRMQADFNVTTDEKPARDFSKLDSNEMQLLGVLLDKLDDPNTPAPDERRNLRHEVREKLTPFEIGVLQSVFRKLDVQYIAEGTVSGLYSTTSLPAQ